MCKRPSCCDNPRSQGTGKAAVALITLAVLVAARIGPIVARIAHTALEVIRIAAMTTGLVLALAAVTWAAIVIIRWQLQRRHTASVNSAQVIASPVIRLSASQSTYPDGCLACGGTGTVLRAINGSGYQPQDCPVCEPARRVG
jgi:hypothetical protein